jgi:hypothetical protein
VVALLKKALQSHRLEELFLRGSLAEVAAPLDDEEPVVRSFSMHKLRLMSVSGLVGTFLQKIVRLLPNLRQLQIIRCCNVDESVLDEIKNDNPDLQVLKVCEHADHKDRSRNGYYCRHCRFLIW